MVFGEHSNTTNIGENAFQQCSALTSITLPDKLKVIEKMAFTHCFALKRIVCNKQLKTFGESAFQACSKLEDVQACKHKKLDYSKDKFIVGELLSVAMRGGGHKGVLGTILIYV